MYNYMRMSFAARAFDPACSLTCAVSIQYLRTVIGFLSIRDEVALHGQTSSKYRVYRSR